MYHTIKAILFMALCLVTHSGFAESEGLYTSRSLSLELASKAVDGAIKACRKKGYSVTVAVVDRGGNVTALLRD
ncbi:MAG: heme-binding protein, partial [Candidatus Thiodiazotropha weberae]|nr:heme-binding protein [Candidatus Thiodiazotropha lotti]MCW4211210.1 heme-binding protein [Candidatus Thiodiazotropha lotti]